MNKMTLQILRRLAQKSYRCLNSLKIPIYKCHDKDVFIKYVGIFDLIYKSIIVQLKF